MRKYKIATLVGIAVLIAAAVLYYFFLKPPPPGEELEADLPEESSSYGEAEEAIEPIEVDLNDSDGLVRNLAEVLSSNPLLARWLMTDDMIRRFVVTVDLISKGDSPRRQMDFIEVTKEFPVREAAGQVFLDPAGYRRYDQVTGVISSLDAKGCATLYRQLRLPIKQAYDELGYNDEDFDKKLEKAFAALLETPVVEDRIYLKKDVLTYLIVDPELENLRAAQKHLLRMGPNNIQAIQEKLREIARYLK